MRTRILSVKQNCSLSLIFIVCNSPRFWHNRKQRLTAEKQFFCRVITGDNFNR